jgi:hypothetical protein
MVGVLMPCALGVWSVAVLAQETKPRGTEVGKPKQSMERPFGGPPSRKPEPLGKQCAAETIVCPAEKPTKIGTDCWCPGMNNPVQGKIVR